ncbi:thiazole tautomerase TenI [Bacillus tamaricis]|uniref:Thiazole tautomerase TenI n=2 Tax=Evansella tamaricis TaxID=2069301 RepID=A0ABS6JCI4_9BACI|nr:thiazole tautomerase TenI [Evansella tamaricis]
MCFPPFEIHVISNGKMSLKDFASKAAVMEPYVHAFHIREKNLSSKELIVGVENLLKMGIPQNKVIINDRVDVAYITDIRGVQLGYQSFDISVVKAKFPALEVGKSVHSISESREAEEKGADFVLYGHIFSTPSKPNLPSRGLTELEKLVRVSKLPVIAIGGIKPQNVRGVLETGVKGIAIMSGLLETDDPLTEVKSYMEEGERVWS